MSGPQSSHSIGKTGHDEVRLPQSAESVGTRVRLFNLQPAQPVGEKENTSENQTDILISGSSHTDGQMSERFVEGNGDSLASVQVISDNDGAIQVIAESQLENTEADSSSVTVRPEEQNIDSHNGIHITDTPDEDHYNMLRSEEQQRAENLVKVQLVSQADVQRTENASSVGQPYTHPSLTSNHGDDLQTPQSMLVHTVTSHIDSSTLPSQSWNHQQKSTISSPGSLSQLCTTIGGGEVRMMRSPRSANIQHVLTMAELSSLNACDDGKHGQVLVRSSDINNREQVVIRQPNVLQSGDQVVKNIQIGQRVAFKSTENITLPTSQSITIEQPIGFQIPVVRPGDIHHPEQPNETVVADIEMLQNQLRDISQAQGNNSNSLQSNSNQVINALLKKGMTPEVFNQVFSGHHQPETLEMAQASSMLQPGLVQQLVPAWNPNTPHTITLDQLSQLSASILGQKNLPEKLSNLAVPAMDESPVPVENQRSVGRVSRKRTESNMAAPMQQLVVSDFVDGMSGDNRVSRHTEEIDTLESHTSLDKKGKVANQEQPTEEERHTTGHDVLYNTQQSLKTMLKQNLHADLIPGKCEYSFITPLPLTHMYKVITIYVYLCMPIKTIGRKQHGDSL